MSYKEKGSVSIIEMLKVSEIVFVVGGEIFKKWKWSRVSSQNSSNSDPDIEEEFWFSKDKITVFNSEDKTIVSSIRMTN